MPKRIEGVSARLINCAKQEFLDKGFLAVSIRELAKKAETSPRSIYTRFPDKEGLFDAIVSPVAAEFKELIKTAHLSYYSDEIQSKLDLSTAQGFQDLMNYVYDYFDEFKLLITCSEGTKFAGFVDELVKMDIDLTTANCKTNMTEHDLAFIESNKFLQLMLTKSFYTSMFEPVICNLSREDASFYIKKLHDFFIFGLAGIMNE